MFCALLGQDIRSAFTGPMVLWLLFLFERGSLPQGAWEKLRRLFYCGFPKLSETLCLFMTLPICNFKKALV